MNRKKAIWGLILASILWSTGGLFIKLIDMNPLAIAGSRSLIAALVMMAFLRKPLKKITKVKVWGAIAYTLLLILFVSANKLTTSANAILLQFTSPFWVLVLSYFVLGEPIQKKDIRTVSIVLLGMVFFFIGNLNFGDLLGNVLAILSGICMASLVLLLKKDDDASSPIEIVLLGNLLTFIVCSPFVFQSEPTTSNVLGILFMGVFQIGFAYILFTLAVRHVSAVEAILIPVIEPLLNPVWVFAFTGETPGQFALIGGVIVIGTVIYHSMIHMNDKVIKSGDRSE